MAMFLLSDWKTEGMIGKEEQKTNGARGKCFKPIMLAQRGKTTMLPVLFPPQNYTMLQVFFFAGRGFFVSSLERGETRAFRTHKTRVG